MPPPPPLSGFLVVDKPAGITSHQVVARARRALGTRKIGHAGTLDPLATGILLLGVGAGTRLLGHLTLAGKTYETTMRLGLATTTDDADGAVTSAPGASGLTRERLDEAVAALTGEIVQVPSAVSAIKVDGRRAYALVRDGQDVQLAGRPVTVSRFEVLAVRPGDADGLPVVDVDAVIDCSSGTYVRALARDLGVALGTGGHLTALRRTRVGPFSIAEATWDAPAVEPGDSPAPAPLLLDLASVARRCLPCVDLDAAAARDVGHGRPLDLLLDGLTAVLSADRLLALYEPGDGVAVPRAVLEPSV
jgi:tRNA pseudouridine55 synthase